MYRVTENHINGISKEVAMKKKTSESKTASATPKGRASKEEQARLKRAILLVLESYGPHTTRELHARMGGNKRLLGYMATALVKSGHLNEFGFAAKRDSEGYLPRIWSIRGKAPERKPDDDGDDLALLDTEDQPDSIASMKGITTEDLEWMQYYGQPRIERQRDRIQSGGYRA